MFSSFLFLFPLVGLIFYLFCGLIDFQFRVKVAELFNQPEEQLCLIFAGKIMKDAESLGHHKLGDGYVVHLVIKSSSRGPQDPSSAPANSTSGNSGTGTAPAGPANSSSSNQTSASASKKVLQL